MSNRPPGQSPICRHLRSKKYYFLDRPPMESSDVLDASNDCWCGVTMERVGPDDEVCHPDDCRAERACFEGFQASRGMKVQA